MPISRVDTVIFYEHGHVHILIVKQALYFGESLYHSIINPNQRRNFGIPVSDNPYDSGQDFGIDREDQFIPFNTEGLTLFFNYFFSMNAKINTCLHIFLTDIKLE